MFYKVTPMLVPSRPQEDREPGARRKRRSTAVYDKDGNEVLISLKCVKCEKLKPLAQFGLRKMGDGAIRNQPWCRPCRSKAGVRKKAEELAAETGGAVLAPLTPAAGPELSLAPELPPGPDGAEG